MFFIVKIDERCPMMDNPLAECELIRLLKTYADSELTEPENIELEEAYNRFVNQVAEMSERTIPAIDFLRCLVVTQLKFEQMKLNLKPSRHRIQLFYIDAAVKVLKCERDLFMLKLKYPEMDKSSTKKYKSPLYWSSTSTDLIELLTAMHAAGIVKKIDGSEAEMTMMVRTFETLFNCHIKNPARCRNAAINRKIRLTRFLDLLKGALTNMSQR